MSRQMHHLGELISPFKHSPKIAVSDGDLAFSYAEIEVLSNKVAARLLQIGMSKGDVVILPGGKTPTIVPVALGIWKAGGIYAPLDENLPQERINRIVENLAPFACLNLDGRHFKHATVESCPCLDVGPTWWDEWEASFSNSQSNSEHDIATLIHTSGSTGLPKAVALDHGSIISYFHGHIEVFRLHENTRGFNTASYHFDVSLQDTFMPLTLGAYVYINKKLFHPQTILPIFQDERITHLTAVVTILKLITGRKENLQYFNLSSMESMSTGAEVCDPALMHAWMEAVPGLLMVNGYGPTEANSASLSYIVSTVDKERVTYYPIGRPHKGVSAFLINDDGMVLNSPKETGELVIGGRQLMRGYWNDEQATARAFIYLNGERYYKTGDLCHLDDQGEFVYEGRRDAEVKIDGRRINLNEVASFLSRAPEVDTARVASIEVNGRTILVAFCSLNAHLNAHKFEQLVSLLRKNLPDYMVPRRFGFYVGEMHGSTGKTDLKWLLNKFSRSQTLHSEPCQLLDLDAEEFRPYRWSVDESPSRAEVETDC